MSMEVFKQGAEARLYITEFLGKKCLIKERFRKLYRHPELERSLSTQRVKNEVRAIVRCRQCGMYQCVNINQLVSHIHMVPLIHKYSELMLSYMIGLF